MPFLPAAGTVGEGREKVRETIDTALKFDGDGNRSASRASSAELQRLGPPLASMPGVAERGARVDAAVAANGFSAFASVFRRCVNIDRTIPSNTASSRTATAGSRNSSRTTAEWTFGAGRNAPGGSVSRRRTSACSCTKIDSTP